jgi:alpha-L-arabinofuranosidase
MNGLSLHYYTRPTGNWKEGLGDRVRRGRLVRHAEKALVMDELITKHAAIMDRHDPDKKVG